MRASPIFGPVRRCRSLFQSDVDHWSNRTSTILSTPQHKHRLEKIKDFGVSSERHKHLNVMIFFRQSSCSRQPRIVYFSSPDEENVECQQDVSQMHGVCFFWCFRYAMTIHFVIIVYMTHQLRLHVVCVCP